MAEAVAGYTVLARRYRPQTFSEVVGQQHVAQALQNAIRAGRVAHAYLFTGARGVGKTSMARILAKALNCTQGAEGNPCNQCDLCQAISTGSDVDVMEIDGASNRGIDDIRSLRANVGIRSMRTRVKIYIIDEVHMLTKEAFNALLKTLEEPPPNVKFVFCTTEPHKVPDTILSRCQRFDFSSIDTQRIAERLAEIAIREQIEVSAEAIDLVARRAGGSMRDSQSLFDQLLAFGGAQIAARDVNQLLGTADDDRLLKIIRCAHGKRQAELLAEIDQACRDGVQLGNLLDQLVNCYRDLLVQRCGADQLELIGIGPSSRPQLQELTATLGISTITAAMEILSEAKSKLARVAHGRALVDLALIRISLLDGLDDLDQLITDLKSGQFAGVALPAGTGTVPGRPSPAPESPQKKSPDVTSAPENQTKSPPVAPADAAKAGKPPAVPEQPPLSDPAGTARSPGDSATHQTLVQPDQPAAVKIPFAEAYKGQLWSEFLARIDSQIATHLKSVRQVAIIAPNRLEIFFPANYAFSKSYFDDKPDTCRRMETCLRELTGETIQVRILGEAAVPAAASASSGAGKGGAAVTPAVTQKGIAKTEFVQAAEAIFSATIARSERVRSTGK